MEADEHLVGLKVMRLARPTLFSTLPVTCDQKDLLGNLLNQAMQKEPTVVPGQETIISSQFLLLPQTPIDIFLGETFSSFMCVFNETSGIVHNVALKVDLQTTSSRIPLLINPPVPQLQPEQTVNNVIHHEVKELGNHILICEVSYASYNGMPTTFKKFFKINVLKPLDVKTKFCNAENDDVYLEAQVTNLTKGPICLEKVSFEPSNSFISTNLNLIDNGESVFGPTTFLPHSSSCQFLYRLRPHPALASDAKQLSEAINIGKLDIVWRSNLGERGRLQTSQLQRAAPVFEEIRLTVVDLPNFLVVEKQFDFRCRLINSSEKTLDLTLSLGEAPGFAWCGVSGRKLPLLPPKSSQEILLSAVPLEIGLHSISGINFLDTAQKKSFSFDELAHVFVLLSSDEAQCAA